MTGGQGGREDAEREHRGPFVASDTGLRDVALEPMPGHRILQRLRYLPLLLLILLVILGSILGTVASRRLDPVAAIDTLPRSDRVLAACGTTPEANLELPQTWSGTSAAAAEDAFAAASAADSPAYVVGEEGFHFFSDLYSANFSQALGRNPLSDADLKAWSDYFVALQAELSVRGIDLVIQVGPAKWDVYPDRLPTWAQEMRAPNNLDRLLSRYPHLPVADPRQSLAESEHPTYSALNSHWSPLGAALAWNHFTACMAARNPDYSVLRPAEVTGVELAEAPSEFQALGVTASADDWAVPGFADELTPVLLSVGGGEMVSVPGDTATDFGALPARSRNDAASPLTALIFRDSMGNDLSRHWQQAFRETVQLPNGFDTGARPDIIALADEHRPDLVIIEFAERYLGTPPTMPADAG